MKRMLVFLVAAALLAGCASETRTTLTPTPSPHAATFTSRAFHFTISYDSSRFEVWSHATTQWQFALGLRLRKGFAGSGYGTDRVGVGAADTGAWFVRDLLREWGKSSHPLWDFFTDRNFPASDGWTAHWTNLGGARGMRYELATGPQRRVAYLLWNANHAYTVEVYATANQWSAVGPPLTAVAQSFTVTK